MLSALWGSFGGKSAVAQRHDEHPQGPYGEEGEEKEGRNSEGGAQNTRVEEEERVNAIVSSSFQTLSSLCHLEFPK